jgi:hypothetical protein
MIVDPKKERRAHRAALILFLALMAFAAAGLFLGII